MPSNGEGLPEELIDAILTKLGISRRPEPSLEGLRTVYSAWCRKVPFDNIRKVMHLRRHDLGPLPGDTALDFFQSWIRFGCGGTCWAGNGALCTLLGSLGFAVQRGIATMLSAPNIPPNHGSTLIRLDGQSYVADASILHGEPLPLGEQPLGEQLPAAGAPPAWAAACSSRDGRSIVSWRPLHKPEGLDCRIEEWGATAAAFCILHEKSRHVSPFNTELYVRLNRADAVIGAAFGQRVTFDGMGGVVRSPLQGDALIQFLIEEIDIEEELARASSIPPAARDQLRDGGPR